MRDANMYCGSAAVYLSFARFAASANRRVLCFGGDNYYISGMTMSLGEKDGRARATKPAAPRAYPSTKTIARTYVDFRRVARNEKGEEESAGRGGAGGGGGGGWGGGGAGGGGGGTEGGEWRMRAVKERPARRERERERERARGWRDS